MPPATPVDDPPVTAGPPLDDHPVTAEPPVTLPPDEIAQLEAAGRRWSAPDRDHPSGGRAPDPDLGQSELRGFRPGERYVRVSRAGSQGFEHVGPGYLQVTQRGTTPSTRWGGLRRRVRRAVLGSALETAQLMHERLTKVKALAVLSSDALSSVAYATDQIFLVLVLAGSAGYGYGIPIMGAILLLLGFVILSYRQTIKAYPHGGGSYIVAKDNLGANYGLIAAAALMTDYVLTVAVSVASGIDAASSAMSWVDGDRVEIALALIVLIMLGNLRGIRESGSIFAAPTYVFIGSVLLMLGVIAFRISTGGLHAATEAGIAATIHQRFPQPVENVTMFVILRAFASGCTALTGVEAISDGVPAFKPPEWRNARTTLTVMATVLAVMFVGITVSAHYLGLVPTATSVLISQLSDRAFGAGTVLYSVCIASTLLILVLAANTSFSDFPRLLFFLARDDYAPHQFKRLGDRLAFSNGILALGVLAMILEIVFRARTERLIPLYAVGVFLAFTMSQAGMVVRWLKRREAGWRHSLPLNFVGMCLTGTVFVIFGASKFLEGAWLVMVIIPVLVALFQGIHHHYADVAHRLGTEIPTSPRELHPICIAPVADLDAVALQSLSMASTISDVVVAVHISDDPHQIAVLREKWAAWGNHVPLEVIESPYRSLVRPLLAYINAIDRQGSDHTIVIVLPELVATKSWHALLHNQTAFRLKAALLFRPGTVVVSVPYHLTRNRRVRRFRGAKEDLDAL